MSSFETMLSDAVQELEKELGHKLDLDNEMYILQTDTAWLKLGFEEGDEGEKELKVEVTGGNVVYAKTNNDIFNFLYGNEEDE